MGSRRIAMLLMLAVGQAWAQAAASDRRRTAKRILLPPPLQWDTAMLSCRPALQQTARILAT